MTDNKAEMSRGEKNFNAHFGGCPECGYHDGFINVGRAHWMICKEHKVKWCVGSNLFSSWRDQTEDEQRKIYDDIGVDEFREITCVEAASHPLVQQWARDLEESMKENGIAVATW